MVPEIRARPMYYAAAACAPPRSHSPAMPAREGWRYGSPPARSDDLEHPLDWAMKSLRLQRSASLWVMYGRFFSGSGAASAATWCIIAFFFRYSSLVALVTAVFAPLYQMLIFGPNILSAALIIISGILVFRHRSNIHHLCCGTEPRIGQKADE